MHGRLITRHSLFKSLSANPRIAVVELNLFNLLLDSKDLNSLYCWQAPSPPTSLAQPLWWLRWHIVLDHQRKVTEPWSAPPYSHSGPASASLPFPDVQQPGSPHPLLIPQSHQARFLEDAISTTSTHRAGALCSSRSRRVIDLVHRLLTGSPIPPPCSPCSMFHCCQLHLKAAHTHQKKKKTDTPHPPTPSESHLSTWANVHPLFTFHRCPRFWLNGVQGSGEPWCTHRLARTTLINTHKMHTRAQPHTQTQAYAPHQNCGSRGHEGLNGEVDG